MKNQLTDKAKEAITDVKRNHSIHSEYYSAIDPIAGEKGKDGELDLSNLTLDNLNDPNFDSKQIEIDKIANEKIASDKVLADAEIERQRIASLGETEEEKAARLLAESNTTVITLDADGNSIDANGTILKTKDVLAEELRLENEANSVSLIEEIMTTSGVVILGEDGKPKVYEDTVEGIIQYNNDVAKYKAKEEQQEFFKAYPKARKYFEAQIKGIPDSEFFGNQLTDWKSTTLDEADVEQQFNVIVKDLEAKGFSKERAIKSATRTKDSGKDVLLEESKLSLESLQGNQIANEKSKADNEALIEKQAEEKRDAHWNKVNEVITSGKMGEYTIPEADRKAFYAYVANAADENGNSAAMIARSKRTLEQSLLMDYYSFKGMKFDGLIKTAVSNEKVNGLRQRIIRANTKGTPENFNNDNKVDLNNIKLENITR